MAKEGLINATVLFAGNDISGLSNSIGGLAASVEEKESTNFASSGWKEFVGVLKSSQWGFEGLFNAGEAGPHGAMFTGGTNPVLVSKTNPIAAGDVAYMVNALRTEHAEDKTLGELHKWSLQFSGDGLMARGICLDTQVATTSTSGSGIQHGAVSSAQKVYASLHVLDSDTLTSLDVKIQSDDNGSFSSATDRITFAQNTSTPDAEHAVLAGPITDDYWRVTWTLVGTSATFVVFLAIQ